MNPDGRSEGSARSERTPMKLDRLSRHLLVLTSLACVTAPGAWAQDPARPRAGLIADGSGAAKKSTEAAAVPREADPLRVEAEGASGLRLLVSLSERRLWLRDGPITLHTAPVGIGKGTTLRHDGRTWTFVTPRGRRRVLAKETNPVWVPPEWHYVELAQRRGFALARLGRDTPLSDGSRLQVRGEQVVHVGPARGEIVLPPDEEIVFDGTLYVPPLGTVNRRIVGELGRYKLDLGDGYLLHGTREADSVGDASTHGCLRVRDEDLELLFQGVPVGTAVYIF